MYRKKELREIDWRIRYLQKRVPALKVVNQLPSDQRQVFFSARVRLQCKDGNEQSYRIVGPDEIGIQADYISLDSPLAQALMGRSLD
ncbi:MAG: transcription elongation factor GreB, partial [gamma proteobacterium symbiont of Ctena orbiculata]